MDTHPARRRTDEIDARLTQLADDIARISAKQHTIEEKITTVENRIDKIVLEMIELRHAKVSW